MDTTEPTPTPYSSIALALPLQHAIQEMGYENMTPIQARAIPVVLAGQDVMGAAQTGTGKTAAFSLPLLQRLLKHENSSMSPARHPVRALVLLPTRELAKQVAEQIKLYAKYVQLRSAVVFGGVDIKPQIQELRQGVEILVATPGRLLDHIESKSVVLNQVEYVVLDEADRMLDIGFLPDLQRILSHLPKQRTTLLFSATFSDAIKKLAGSYLQRPVSIEVSHNSTAKTVEQHFYYLDEGDKRRAIKQLLRDRNLTQAFVFCNSRLGTARLARDLARDGLKTTAMHGDKTQDDRLQSLQAFKAGDVDLLVATDVAARGLDIEDIPAVFNYDVPFNPEDYVHRIGRTGRAGADGVAFTLVTRGNQRQMDHLEQLLGKKLDLERLDFDDDRPSGGHNYGQRRWRDDRSSSRRSDAADKKPVRSQQRQRQETQPQNAAADPFFDRPYEPEDPLKPATERTSQSRSSNIKSKRKVAALFKAESD